MVYEVLCDRVCELYLRVRISITGRSYIFLQFGCMKPKLIPTRNVYLCAWDIFGSHEILGSTNFLAIVNVRHLFIVEYS